MPLNLPIIHQRVDQVSMNISTQIMDLFALHQNDSKDSFIQCHEFTVLVLDIVDGYFAGYRCLPPDQMRSKGAEASFDL